MKRVITDESTFLNDNDPREKKLVSNLLDFMTGRALKL